MRRLRRCKGRRALLEGPHLVSEALDAGYQLEAVLATPEFLAGDTGRQLLPRLPRPPLEVASQLLREAADSDAPRGIVAIVDLPRQDVVALPRIPGGVYVFAEGLQDPGNLGALARAAEASGAAGLCLSPGTVHPNHPRALRGSAGSLLRLPVAIRSSAAELSVHLDPLSPAWAALVPTGGRDLYAEPLTGTVVLALGTEGAGLSSELQQRATLGITIPLAAPVESLNATVAAAVVLFEMRRQRRDGEGNSTSPTAP
jgi:TrmH family RNA methyltransferase